MCRQWIPILFKLHIIKTPRCNIVHEMQYHSQFNNCRHFKFPLSFYILFCTYVQLLVGIYYCVYVFQLSVPDSALTESEIENVSREVQDDVKVLAREMDMEYILEEAKKSRVPKQDIARALIADFAEEGTRNRLVQHLRSANFHNTAQK